MVVTDQAGLIVATRSRRSGADMDPISVATIAAPVVGEVISGLFGDERSEDAAESARIQQQINYEHQKEFAQHGIRWKTEDARAAGLHPLFALGGAGAAFSPNPVVVSESNSWSGMGQGLSRAAQAAVSLNERASQQALVAQQIKESQSRESLNFVQAQAIESKRVLDEQGQWSEFPGPGPFAHMEGQGVTATTMPVLPPVVAGQVKGVPAEQISRQVGQGNTIAGSHARFMEGEVTPGVTLLLPHQGGQFQEDMTMVDVPNFINANVKRFGWNGFLGRWLTGSKKLVELHKWDEPLVDAISQVINLMRRK